jgi:predicted membrane protein
MRGIPQTNVMTGNMTQLGLETTALLLAWRRRTRDPNDRESEREFVAVRSRLLIVLAIAIGFVLGAGFGAISYAKAGLAGAPLAVVIVAALTLWAVWRERET